MISVGIKELKAQLSAYVARARHGEEIVVTDRGKEVAMVVPVSREREAITGLLTSGRAAWAGGKPRGVTGTRIKGKPLSATVLEGRR
jgi:prevent-host-death family protein